MNNLPLYLVSFEYESQDELISMLIEPRSYEKYDSGQFYGRHKPLISDANVKILEEYMKLCNSLKKKPTIELLKQKFPTMNFDNIKPIPYAQLEETIKIDIEKLKQKDNSFKLMYISNIVNQEGVTAEVIDELLDLTKEDKTNSTYRDLLPDLKGIYEKASLQKGIKTGVSQVDERTGGLQPGTFNCLAGFAGAGKTTAAVNIVYNALKDGKNVCYITLEVPKIDMYYNFGSRHSFEKDFPKPISHSFVKKRELSKKDADYFFDTVLTDFAEKYGNSLYILDETEFESYTFRSFESKIKECDTIATDKTGKGIDLLVIDQAQLLKFSNDMSSAGNETSVINLYVSFFRQQAINFLHSKRPCTVLMLSQINRTGFEYASKHDGRYTLTNLAEANELERASAIVLALYTDESLKASKQVSIQMLKSRNGETLVDPVIAFMDPVYYVFGSEVSDSGAIFDGSTADLFGSFGETMDLNTDSAPMSFDFSSTEGGPLI